MSAERKPLVVFIHVQRTAGKTLQRVLRHQFGHEYEFVGTFRDYDVTLERVRAIGADPKSPVRAIRGHMAFGVRRWLPGDTRFVTILRDPVDRVLSHYRYMHERRPRIQPFGLPPMPPDLTLDECVADGRYLLDNLQTRMLRDSPSPLGEATPQRLAEAKQNLRDRFTFVGLVERFDESLVLLNSVLGLPQVAYRRLNAEPGGPRREDVPARTLRLIEARNELDLELYDLGRTMFDELVGRQGPEFELDLAALRRAVGTAPAPESDATNAPLVDARARALVAWLERSEERQRAERAEWLLELARQRLERQQQEIARLASWKAKLKARLRDARENAPSEARAGAD